MVQTLLSLFAALALGIVIGWALRSMSLEGELKEKERIWRERLHAERSSRSPAATVTPIAPVASAPAASAPAVPAAGFSPTVVVSLQNDLAACRDASAKKDAEILRMRSLLYEIEGGEPVPITPGITLRDDLTKIRGIGPVLERALNKYGIFNYRQIALWTERDAEQFAAHTHEYRSRILRDNWVEQARRLHRELYGETL
jgi:predicted flap endonuclease-1-like 5' DNA nuclease